MSTFQCPSPLLTDVLAVTCVLFGETEKRLNGLLIWLCISSIRPRGIQSLLTILVALNLHYHLFQAINSLVATLLR